MKIKLTHYLNQIENKYVNARERWEQFQKELETEKTRFDNVKWNHLSAEGKRAEVENHKSIERELYREMENIRKEFSEDVQKIRDDSDKVFNRVFQYTAGDVDMNGVAILQNGILKDSELISLAENYRKQGNYTMYFMVSEKLKKDKIVTESDKRANDYYNEAQRRRNTREDHDIMDGFVHLCLSALRDEGYLSNAIHREHDRFYMGHMELAETIETDVPSPWEG